MFLHIVTIGMVHILDYQKNLIDRKKKKQQFYILVYKVVVDIIAGTLIMIPCLVPHVPQINKEIGFIKVDGATMSFFLYTYRFIQICVNAYKYTDPISKQNTCHHKTCIEYFHAWKTKCSSPHYPLKLQGQIFKYHSKSHQHIDSMCCTAVPTLNIVFYLFSKALLLTLYILHISLSLSLRVNAQLFLC